MSVKQLCLIAVAAVLGCGGATPGLPGASQIPRTPSILTGEEIAAAHADVGTAYAAVARLRPNWLAPHGPMSSNPQASDRAAIYVDGQPYGELESLKNIQAYQVADIRYYDVTQSGARFGIRAGMCGVIEVRSRVK